MSFFSRIFVAIIQVLIGAVVAFRFQRKSFHYQNRIRDLQDKANTIIKISSEISEAYTKRKVRTNNLLQSLKTDNPNIGDYRKSYREAVEQWNIMLNKQNILLNSVELYGIAKEKLEGDIHKDFLAIHQTILLLLEEIDKEQKVTKDNINNALITLGGMQEKNLKLTNILLNKAKEEMDKSEGYKKVELSKVNLESATTWELIRALYSSSNRFSIKSSIF